jgi:WD40 repeat protein
VNSSRDVQLLAILGVTVTGMRYLLIIVLCIVGFKTKAQEIFAADELIFKTNAGNNQLSLYQPAKDRLVVFEKNQYWFCGMDGKLVEGPFILSKKEKEPRYPRLSPSGNYAFLYYAPADILSDGFVTVVDLDSCRMMTADKLLSVYQLHEVTFVNEHNLKYEAVSEFNGVHLDKFWEFAKERYKYFGADSSNNGLLDFTLYNDKMLFNFRKGDSAFLFALDTLTKKPVASDSIKLNLAKSAKAIRFTEGYPWVYLVQRDAISFYRFDDSSFHLKNTLPTHFRIVAAAASAKECYMLLQDTSLQRDHYYTYDAVSNTLHPLAGTFAPKTIFKIYPEKKWISASHPYDGTIGFFNAGDGKLLHHIVPVTTGNTGMDVQTALSAGVIQHKVSVMIRQGNQSLKTAYDESKDEIIQIRKNRIAFIDAVSGCLKRSIPYKNEDRELFEWSLNKKLVLSRSVSYKDAVQEYYDLHVYDLDSTKVILNVQSVKKDFAAGFLNDRVIYVEAPAVDDKAAVYVYDIITHQKQLYVAPQPYYPILDVAASKDHIYFIFRTDSGLLLQNEHGKELLRVKHGNINSRTAYFSKGVPYLFIEMPNGKTAVHRLANNKAFFVRYLPSDIFVQEARGEDTACYVYYQDNLHYRYEVIKGVTSTDRSLSELNDQAPVISSIVYSTDGRYLATANPYGKVMLWDLATGKETRVLHVERSGYITKLAFTADGSRLAASSGDIWETATGKNILSVTDPNIYDVNTIDISKNGKYIISAGAFVLLWEAESGEIIRTYWNPDSSAYTHELGRAIKEDYKYLMHSLALHPVNGTFVTGDNAGDVFLWSIDTGYIRSSRLYCLQQQRQRIKELKYTTDGEHLLVMQEKVLYKLNSSTLAIEDSIVDQSSHFAAIDLSTDGNTFASLVELNGAQVIQIRRLKDLSLIKEFTTPGAVFNQMSFSPDKKHLATASSDGFCTIWDIDSARAVMYLNNIGDFGNVMVTPDNYYMASKSALDNVALAINGEYYSFEQFDVYLNRPDIVLSRLGYASPELLKIYRSAYEKRLKNLAVPVKDSAINYMAPTLQLTERSTLPAVSKNAVITLRYHISDPLNTGGNLQVFVNKNKVFTKRMDSAINYMQTIKLTLGQGNNLIEAVYTNRNNIESRKEKIKIEHSPLKPLPSKVYYFGIGVSRYKDSSMNLRFAAKDIRDLAAAVHKKYPNAVIDTLLNSSATTENIKALRQKLMRTTINDKVIISFSGHGLVDDSLNWYFATWDIDIKNPALKGLSYTAMQDVLNDIPARQKLILMDACHSGEQDKSTDITFANKETAMAPGVKEAGSRGISIRGKPSVGLQNSFELMQELFANLQNGNGATVISAAGGKEYAFENDTWKNGVFTYSVLNALKSIDTDSDEDGKVNIKELKQAVFATVRSLTGGRQKPTSRTEVNEDWVIW